MIQAILIGVVGFLIFSVFQTVRRGKVTPKERKENPTQLEKISDFADELHKRTSVQHAKTKFQENHCQWFRTFRDSVSMILECPSSGFLEPRAA